MAINNFRLFALLRRLVGVNFLAWARFLELFDAEYYLTTQSDVATLGEDPRIHYLELGWQEGRSPARNFNNNWYLHTYSDAAASGIAPLMFHSLVGHRDGRATVPDPAARWSLHALRNGDLPSGVRNFLQDYLAVSNSGLFEEAIYVENGGFLSDDPIEHFVRFGKSSDINPSSMFDPIAYLATRPDVEQSRINPFFHFVRHGRFEINRTKSGRRLEVEAVQALEAASDEKFMTEWLRRSRMIEESGPSLSVIVPCYNSDVTLLRRCCASIMANVYRKFELILIDDASTKADVSDVINEIRSSDDRIKAIFRSVNGNISAATNDGLAASSGEFVVFVDHDDEVTPDATLMIAESIISRPNLDVLYSDQIKVDHNGVAIEHFFKPDWSPVYLLGVMYVGHVLAVRRKTAVGVGGFDGSFDGVQDFEFVLRLSETTSEIGHLGRPLYNWRAIPGSLASGTNEKAGISEKQRLAVQQHLERLGRTWKAHVHPRLPHRIILKSGSGSARPRVSIVIPSRNQGEIVGRCLDTIFQITEYPNFEVIVVDNQTTEADAIAALSRHPIVRVPFDKIFNFSDACNEGARRASGEFVIFLNNDTEIVTGDWIDDLLMYFEDEGVGAVGPTLLYPDGRVQHAGVVLGARGTADHVMRFFPDGVDGYAGSLACTREVSAVTAACIMMRLSLFDSLNGFSSDFAKHYQDVDLCLRIRKRSLRILNVGSVRLLHHESVSRKQDGYDFGDRALLIDRWYEVINAVDPYFNRAFDLAALDYSLRN